MGRAARGQRCERAAHPHNPARLFEQHKRDCALELILAGNEATPIAVVQRQRRRLLSAWTRDGLAASLEDVVRYVSSGPKRRSRIGGPLYEPRVVAAVADELREVIALLRAEGVSARGVARVERLIKHAVSPLYGLEVALREELGCVRDLLEGPER